MAIMIPVKDVTNKEIVKKLKKSWWCLNPWKPRSSWPVLALGAFGKYFGVPL